MGSIEDQRARIALQLWETTAVAEIGMQASQLAKLLISSDRESQSSGRGMRALEQIDSNSRTESAMM